MTSKTALQLVETVVIDSHLPCYIKHYKDGSGKICSFHGNGFISYNNPIEVGAKVNAFIARYKNDKYDPWEIT